MAHASPQSIRPGLSPFVGSPGQVALGWIGLAIAAGATVGFAALMPSVADGASHRVAWPWVPSLGVFLSFSIDGLSLAFALLITGIGALIVLYSGHYMAGHRYYGRFFVYLIAFMAAMLGLVTADNLITLFVFWELTTITSYLLIGFDHDSEKARRSALQALMITGAGGLALLAGLLLLGMAGGSLELSELVRNGDAIRADPLYPAILVLVLLGAFTKSAQFPFHFWLPNAMAAPTPVSAYLHSATMVKAGIYLLARLHPALGGTPEWIWALTIAGAVTAVWASVLALRQTDLKLALAYTTVMALGTLTMFLGSEARIGIAAAVTFLFVHSLYKSTLFLVVGNVDHGCGTREVDRLGGLVRAMPMTAAVAAVAALSMAGFPPFLGFVGKELKYEGALAIASEPWLVASAAVAANMLMVVVAGVVAVRPFYGAVRDTPRLPHEASAVMLAGPALLAAAGLLAGMVPPYVGGAIVQPAVSAILGEPETVKLALWHGINLPLVLSAFTLAGGVALYLGYPTLRRLLTRALSRLPASGDRLYDGCMDALVWIARVQTRAIQGGRLRRYLFVVFAVITVGVGATLWTADGPVWSPSSSSQRFPGLLFPSLHFYEWGVCALVAGGAVVAVATVSRWAAICGLGAVGTGIALIFLMFGAPDVAMTQALVEILFIIIIAAVFLKVPGFRGQGHGGRVGRAGDAVLAVCAGTVMAVLLAAVTAAAPSPHLSDYFAAQSVPEAHGRNIVNVILVDFRALDTLGEITVVAVAALAAFALLKLRAPAPEQTSRERPSKERTSREQASTEQASRKPAFGEQAS